MTNKAGIALSSEPEDAVVSAAITSGATIGSDNPLARAGVISRLRIAAANVFVIVAPKIKYGSDLAVKAGIRQL